MVGLLMAAAVVAMIAVIGFFVALAVSSKRKYAADAELVPGRPSSAPAHWAGAHTPEAKLHRRLVAALRGLQANPRRGDAAFAGLVADLEHQAVAIDERLVVLQSLPETVKAEQLGKAEAAVAAVEDAVGKLALQMADAYGVDEVAARIDFVVQARAELEALEARDLSDLQRRIEEGIPADGQEEERRGGEPGTTAAG